MGMFLIDEIAPSLTYILLFYGAIRDSTVKVYGMKGGWVDAWSVYKKENPWKHFKKYWHPIVLNLDIFVTNEIRIQLYSSLMYPFLT